MLVMQFLSIRWIPLLSIRVHCVKLQSYVIQGRLCLMSSSYHQRALIINNEKLLLYTHIHCMLAFEDEIWFRKPLCQNNLAGGRPYHSYSHWINLSFLSIHSSSEMFIIYNRRGGLYLILHPHTKRKHIQQKNRGEIFIRKWIILF